MYRKQTHQKLDVNDPRANTIENYYRRKSGHHWNDVLIEASRTMREGVPNEWVWGQHVESAYRKIAETRIEEAARLAEKQPNPVCCDCGDPCGLIEESFDYAGTHCTGGKPGTHKTGFFVSACCGADWEET